MENFTPKIIFIGTPEFGAITLEGLIKGGYKPVLVVTSPDKPVGRKQILTPSPVKLLAEKYDIEICQPNSGQIKNCRPDLIIVAAYGKILPKEILEIPKYGCLNVHPSLLPKYRGPTPVQFSILNGDEETGVTIILMDEQIDHGPILAQKTTVIGAKETAKQLQNRLAQIGVELLIDAIPDWIRDQIKPNPQDEKKVSYTKILTRENGKIDWKKPAKDIERQIRAFDPWPENYTFWKREKRGVQLKILKARVLETIDSKTYPVGKTLIAPQNELCIQCGKGFLIIEKLQPEGKKPMNSEDFLRGNSDFIGIILK